MGGCFPCFGSSNKEGSGGGAVKEVAKKDSVKEGSVALSHHVGRVSSGTFLLFLKIILVNSLWLL